MTYPGAMRRLLLLGALAALALPAGAAAKTIQFSVTSVGKSVVTHDKKPKGASKGDTIVYHDQLLNAAAQFGKAKGAAVGTDHGTMTFTSPHAARFSGIARLPDGSLTIDGRVTALSNGYLTIPVTGGTGAYEGAKGILVVGPGKKRALNIYRITITSGNVA
jgi:Allene oxide cyclase barrel like domain